MSSVRWFDRAGQPINVWEASDLLAEYDYKVVRKDVFVLDGEPVEVSTVWLGLDHNMDLAGPPLIFETMIFGGQHNQECWRYGTEAQALRGHGDVVRFLKETVG